jgi:hypothetical protein
MADLLFNSGYLHAFLDYKRRQLDEEVLGFQRDYLLNASEEDLCTYLINKYKLETISVNVDKKEIVETRPIMVQRTSAWGDGQYHAQGQLIVLAVPFEGDPELFKYLPSSCLMRGVSARVEANELVLQYEVVDEDSSRVDSQLGQDMSAITQNSSAVTRDVSAYNQELLSRVPNAVAARKRTLLSQMNFVDSLKIPVRRRDGAPQTYAVPSVKRKARIERPAVPSGPYKPEPTLLLEEYEYILSVAQNMAVMLERSPSTFAKLTEEEIRDHFLVQLNGHYDGQATGETFNHHGKTDILIRENGRNVFIAECKFWGGAKAFGGIIDQLLGYTSWRDTKTAIFIFNRNKDTSKVLDQIMDLVKSHPNYKRESPGRLDETRFRFVLHQQGDTNREFYLTICVYDIPSS